MTAGERAGEGGSATSPPVNGADLGASFILALANTVWAFATAGVRVADARGSAVRRSDDTLLFASWIGARSPVWLFGSRARAFG